MCGHQKHRAAASFSVALSFLCLTIYLKQSLHTQLHLSLFLFLSSSGTAVHLSVSSVFWGGVTALVCVGAWRGLFIWGSCCGARVGYASRRAMLQQLHGVTMYSHDEHHTSAPYCWSERGKGASATNPSTAVLLIIIRPSISQYVSPSCGPVPSKTCLEAVGLVPTCRTGLMSSLQCMSCRQHTFEHKIH